MCMKSTKEAPWRITVRLEGSLRAKVERAAKGKRWSINDYIEEALIEKLATESAAIKYT